jgi:hypothetical protein
MSRSVEFHSEQITNTLAENGDVQDGQTWLRQISARKFMTISRVGLHLPRRPQRARLGKAPGGQEMIVLCHPILVGDLLKLINFGEMSPD